MKKLELFGFRKNFFGREVRKQIATIYVRDGKVVVESEMPKLREILQQAIEHEAYSEKGIESVGTLEGEGGGFHKPEDSNFLEELRMANLWVQKDEGRSVRVREWDGWFVSIPRSKVVDE